MNDKQPRRRKRRSTEPDLFAGIGSRRRRVLILPRYLAEEADKFTLRGERQDRAWEILKRWADLAEKGHLDKKETALDAGFLHEVFGDALGYKLPTKSPDEWQLERNYYVPGVGTADAALGDFRSNRRPGPTAVIELKGADADLDLDRFNGRTPVQQCWDYLNALPDCPWAIVSNFVTFRLYHRNRTQLAYEEFHLKDLRDLDIFRRFYCLFEMGGLLPSALGQQPRALQLLSRTEDRRREVGDQLYEAYSENRFRLIEHLQAQHGKRRDAAIHIAQKILDRIIFIAFCEQRGLLPERCLEETFKNVAPFSRVTNPRWQNFLDLFHAIDKGHKRLDLETGYDGGLFRHDPEVDNLQLDDSWTTFFQTVGSYDFRDEVNVDVLGHLFERSIGELERLRAGGFFEAAGPDAAQPTMQKSAERKRFGIYYTPPEFTTFIVHHTVAALIEERLETVRNAHKLELKDLEKDTPSPALAAYWNDCLQAVRAIKICDAACGSGAFLILLNPNTRTCPIFRSRRDAELTKAIYRRVPILIDENRDEGGNPWGIKYLTMFHQTNDAELFHEAEELQKLGCKLKGNRWEKNDQVFLPLYEAKMIQAYDHRAASVVVQAGNWVRQGQTEPTSVVSHQNPGFVVQPRWWVDQAEVIGVLKGARERGFIGFKDITSPTNQRTMIAAGIPWSAVTNHFPLMLTTAEPRLEMCLLANLNAFVADYAARQKIGGVTLNFFIVNQLPLFPPDRYAQRCPWDKRETLEKWISDRVLKLTCTANDMKPLAVAAGFNPPVHKWQPGERAELLAELDAAFFHLYGIDREDVEYILSTFRGLDDDGDIFQGSPAKLILEAYDRLGGGEA